MCDARLFVRSPSFVVCRFAPARPVAAALECGLALEEARRGQVDADVDHDAGGGGAQSATSPEGDGFTGSGELRRPLPDAPRVHLSPPLAGAQALPRRGLGVAHAGGAAVVRDGPHVQPRQLRLARQGGEGRGRQAARVRQDAQAAQAQPRGRRVPLRQVRDRAHHGHDLQAAQPQGDVRAQAHVQGAPPRAPRCGSRACCRAYRARRKRRCESRACCRARRVAAPSRGVPRRGVAGRSSRDRSRHPECLVVGSSPSQGVTRSARCPRRPPRRR